MASRLSIYSPTPLGWENGGQPLKCTESFPGDPLNYASGPCMIFSPYKVGHPFSPEVYIERTWSKYGPFHVTHRVRTGMSKVVPPGGPPRGCIHGPSLPANLGASKNRGSNPPPTGQSAEGVSKPQRQLASLGVSTGCVQNLAWEGARPPAGPRPTGQSAGPNSTSPRRILRTGERPAQPEPTSAGRSPMSAAPTGEWPRRRDAGPVGDPVHRPPPSARRCRGP